MTQPIYHDRHRRHAFSMVELVIVLSIIAVLAALAVPRFASAGDRYRASLAADRISRDIAYARQRAISRGATQTVTFTPASRSYIIVSMANPDQRSSTYTVLLGAEPYRAVSLSANFGGSESLSFNGFGIPVAAGVVTVSTAGSQCTVTVSADTGVVVVSAVN